MHAGERALGKSDGTFQAAVNYDTGPQPTSVAVADFNLDGKLDLRPLRPSLDDYGKALLNIGRTCSHISDGSMSDYSFS